MIFTHTVYVHKTSLQEAHDSKVLASANQQYLRMPELVSHRCPPLVTGLCAQGSLYATNQEPSSGMSATYEHSRSL